MKNPETKEVVKVSVDELVKVLLSLDKTNFVYIETVTPFTMNKGGRGGVPSNPYYGKVMKRTRLNVRPINDYEKRVNNNLEKDGKERNFVSEGKDYIEVLSDFVTQHKDTKQMYFRYESFNTPIESILLYDGLTVDKDNFKVWEKKYSSNNEYKPEYRNVKVENIKRLHCQGVEYVVE